MKKLLLIVLSLSFLTPLFSQNVGIGLTNPAQKLHVQGNLRLEGRTVFFGPKQTLYGDNSSAFYLDGGHATIVQLILRDPDNTQYGRVSGSGGGRYFGLRDGDGNWTYLTDKDVSTSFRVDNNEKMRILANGRVGIGTSSPNAKLSVIVDTLQHGLSVLSPHFGNTYLSHVNGNSYIAGKNLIFRTTNTNTERMRVTSNGYVGVGVTNPLQRFHTLGNIRLDGRTIYLGAFQTISGNNASALYFDGNHSTVTQFILRDKENDQYGRLYGSGDGANFGLLDGDANWGIRLAKDAYTSFHIDNSEKMRILENGNVGIGTNSPNSKLAVNGNIRSREVLVETANWPDYVFKEEYKLPTLVEEEEFIATNGHLSGFDSEAEMNGTITVGDVTKKQQEKIEQMMLHLITISKEMEEMKGEIKELKVENSELKNKLNKN